MNMLHLHTVYIRSSLCTLLGRQYPSSVIHFLTQRLGFNPRAVYTDSDLTKCHRFWFIPQRIDSAVSCQSSFFSHSRVFVKVLQPYCNPSPSENVSIHRFSSCSQIPRIWSSYSNPSIFLVPSGLKKINFLRTDYHFFCGGDQAVLVFDPRPCVCLVKRLT